MTDRRSQKDFDGLDMLRLFNRGMSVNKIAETYNTNWPMVKRILAKQGVKPLGVQEATTRHWRQVAPAKHKAHKTGALAEGSIGTAYRAGTSINRLAVAYGVTAYQIQRVLVRLEVPLRKREAAQQAAWWDKTAAERREATRMAVEARAAKRKGIALAIVPHLTPLEAKWLAALSTESAALGTVEPLYPLGGLTLDLALPDSRVALMVCNRHAVSARVERRLASYADVLAEHGWVCVSLRPNDFESERMWLVMALLRRLASCRCEAAPKGFVGGAWMSAVGKGPPPAARPQIGLGAAAGP